MICLAKHFKRKTVMMGQRQPNLSSSEQRILKELEKHISTGHYNRINTTLAPLTKEVKQKLMNNIREDILSFVVKAKKPAILELLLEAAGVVRSQVLLKANNSAVFTIAVQNNDPQSLELLLKAIGSKDRQLILHYNNFYLFLVAMEEGYIQVAKLLLKAIAPEHKQAMLKGNEINGKYLTMYCAASKGQVESVKLLLEECAPENRIKMVDAGAYAAFDLEDRVKKPVVSLRVMQLLLNAATFGQRYNLVVEGLTTIGVLVNKPNTGMTLEKLKQIQQPTEVTNLDPKVFKSVSKDMLQLFLAYANICQIPSRLKLDNVAKHDKVIAKVDVIVALIHQGVQSGYDEVLRYKAVLSVVCNQATNKFFKLDQFNLLPYLFTFLGEIDCVPVRKIVMPATISTPAISEQISRDAGENKHDEGQSL
jgi:hypothetical protein